MGQLDSFIISFFNPMLNLLLEYNLATKGLSGGVYLLVYADIQDTVKRISLYTHTNELIFKEWYY